MGNILNQPIEIWNAYDPQLRPRWARVYDSPDRPALHVRARRSGDVCRQAGHYLVKRMPDTVVVTVPRVIRFEPELGLSVGNLMGER